MSVFREPPAVELGPLAVGLGHAARRALDALPSGGRLLGPVAGRAPYALGALGSLSLVLVTACALAARAAGWSPRTPGGAGVVAVFVIAGGLSLAAVLRALDVDAPRARRTLRGDRIGGAARLALRRAARLADHAERRPERFGPRRVAALRAALRTLADPAITAWIPDDVRGRAELLLARALAAGAGPRWSQRERVRGEVRALLEAAATHMDQPAPAKSDLRALDELNAPTPRPASPEEPPGEADEEALAAEEAAAESAALADRVPWRR